MPDIVEVYRLVISQEAANKLEQLHGQVCKASLLSRTLCCEVALSSGIWSIAPRESKVRRACAFSLRLESIILVRG